MRPERWVLGKFVVLVESMQVALSRNCFLSSPTFPVLISFQVHRYPNRNEQVIIMDRYIAMERRGGLGRVVVLTKRSFPLNGLLTLYSDIGAQSDILVRTGPTLWTRLTIHSILNRGDLYSDFFSHLELALATWGKLKLPFRSNENIFVLKNARISVLKHIL